MAHGVPRARLPMRSMGWLLSAGLVASAGCNRASLADQAFDAPVDGDGEAATDTPGPETAPEARGDGGSPAPEPVGPRDDFSPQTEALCEVAICSFRDKVAVEQALEEARISARAERDDTEALEALAAAFGAADFSADDAIAYFAAVDPPDDDLVAQLSRVLSRIHDALDATQRDALAAEIARVGPKEVLGIGRRGFRSAPERAQGDGEGRGPAGRGGQGRRRGKRDPNTLRERQRARIDRMCEVLACTDDQRAALVAELARIEREDFDSEIASMNLKLAVLFRADAAPPEAVARQLRALRDKNAGRDRMRASLLETLHDLLTPEQRASAAARMRVEPPGRALGLVGRRAG